MRLDPQGDIASRQCRSEISDRRAAAPAVGNGHLVNRKPFLVPRVVIVSERESQGITGLRIRRRQGILIAVPADLYRAIPAAIFVLATFPCFLTAEIRQHVCVGPVIEAGGGPTVVVRAMAAHLCHRVY